MSALISQSMEVIRKRVDEVGTTEPIIQRQGQDRVLVQVPGYDDSARLKELISTTARLTFHLVHPTMSAAQAEAQGVPAGYMLLLTTSGYDLDAELEQARNLISRGVDGLVLRGDCHHDALRKLLADNAGPFVNVGVYRPDRPYPCVGTNNEAAAHREIWLRDPDGYVVVLASPDGEAG